MGGENIAVALCGDEKIPSLSPGPSARRLCERYVGQGVIARGFRFTTAVRMFVLVILRL